MGASIIGHPCARHVWLTWRWSMTPEFPGRILRLFDTGKREEARLVEELKGIGAQVWEFDEGGKQFTFSTHDGHFGGSLDGIVKGVPEGPKTAAVVEFKTHSAKSFADLLKNKVEQSKPQHYAQMQVYMGLMELERALYLAVNKDDDTVYSEWVHFNKDAFTALLDRAKNLIEMSTPPERLSEDPSFWQCKWCSHWKTCHGGQAAEANCRTCCHASPVENSQWRCEMHQGEVPLDFQSKGCDQHLLIPALVPYAEAVDGGEAWVAYRHRETGKMFVNSHADVQDYGPVFSSKELHHCPDSLLEGASDLKTEFPGAKVVSGIVNPPPFDIDDIASHPDDIEVKRESPKKRASKKDIAAQLKAFGGEE